MKRFLLLAITFLLLFGCEEEKTDSVVITEDAIYISGQVVRLSGRIYSDAGLKTDNHGFQISKSENFDSEIISVELGETTSIGQFIGSDSTLEVNSQYFYRAFMQQSGALIFGQIKSFQTLSSKIKSFSPLMAYEGDIITIDGLNFSSDSRVYFGDNEGEIEDILLESIIKVKVPNITNNVSVPIRVVTNGVEYTIDQPFEYIIGEWNQIGEFVAPDNIFDGISINTGSELIYGHGRKTSYEVYNKVWKLDYATWQWSTISFPGEAAHGVFHNNSGVFGAGGTVWPTEGGEYFAVNQTWKYDGGTFTELGSSPYLYKGVSFNLNGEDYLFGGYETVPFGEQVVTKIAATRKLYKFNTTIGAWEQIGVAPFEFNSGNVSFTYNEDQYFLAKNSKFWKYDGDSQIFEQLVDYPFDNSTNGFSEVFDGKVFIGGITNDERVWQYDVENDYWKSKYRFPGNGSFKNSAHFNYDSKLYVIRVNSQLLTNEKPMIIWEFDPEVY